LAVAAFGCGRKDFTLFFAADTHAKNYTFTGSKDELKHCLYNSSTFTLARGLRSRSSSIISVGHSCLILLNRGKALDWLHAVNENGSRGRARRLGSSGTSIRYLDC
jgi:hypothetical protein